MRMGRMGTVAGSHWLLLVQQCLATAVTVMKLMMMATRAGHEPKYTVLTKVACYRSVTLPSTCNNWPADTMRP